MTNIDRASTDLLLYESRGCETKHLSVVEFSYFILSIAETMFVINDIKILTARRDFIDTRV